MKYPLFGAAAGAVVLVLCLHPARGQTLLYSFETIVPSGLAPPNDGDGPDGFVPNDGGTITQDTFGATDGSFSLKYSQTETDTFTGLQTGVGLPFPIINAATTTAISVDLTIKAGEEFIGGFASLGVTEFGSFEDPELGTLGGQAQTIAASEQNVELAAGTYRLIIPLIARSNQHSESGRPNISFNGVFETDPLGIMTPTAVQFYINKGPTTGEPSVPNAPFTAYFDNVRAVSVPVSSWRTGANANWSAGANWFGLPALGAPPGSTAQAPNAVDAIAQFGLGQIAGPVTVAVDVPITVGTLYFNSGNSYTLGGTSTLTLDVTSGQAAVHVYNGAHVITAPLVLNDDATLNVMGHGSLTIGGEVTATGRTITKSGDGPAQMERVVAGGLNVAGGAMRISAKPDANDVSGTSVVQSLAIGSGAQLDLANNSLVIDYSDAAGTLVDDLRQHLQSGRMITGSGSLATGLGYGDNAVLNKTTHGGVAVDASSLLVKFTYFGDSDLDGDVDVADLGNLASSWQTSNVWTGGDFDFSGFVDVNDLGLLASNWQAGVGNPLGPSLQEVLASVGLGHLTVPEPTALGLVGLLAARSLTRPGRRRNGKGVTSTSW